MKLVPVGVVRDQGLQPYARDMLDRLILNMANSTWAPRPQPDGRVAVYYFPRRALVLLDDAGRIRRRKRFLTIIKPEFSKRIIADNLKYPISL